MCTFHLYANFNSHLLMEFNFGNYRLNKLPLSIELSKETTFYISEHSQFDFNNYYLHNHIPHLTLQVGFSH